MNILYATHGYKPAYKVGGPIITISAMAENLVKRGHKVVVYTSNSNLDEDLDVPLEQPVIVDGVEVWYFAHQEPIKKLLPFIPYLSQSMGYLYLPSLLKILRQHISEFDVVHSHMPFVYPTYVIPKEAIRKGIPVFYHQRGAFAPTYLRYRGLKKRIYISLFEKYIMNRAASLIALTEADVESYRGLGVKTACRIIPNGVEVADYAQSYQGELRLDENFVISQDDILILFLARLHVVKGADFMLDVFLKLCDKYPNARLVLAGPDQHGFRESLLKKIDIAGAQAKIALPGMVTGDLKRNLLARADLFCQPSLGEGFSVSILEAMASKTPVIATPQCNFPEIEQSSAGWVLEKDLTKWVQKISELLENPSELRTRGSQALELVKNLYTWERIVDQLEAVYMEGLQQSQRSSQRR